MESLRDILGTGQYWAEARAQIALELSDKYAKQEISKEEYVELLEDLIRTDEVDSEANDVAVKNMLVTGIMGLIQAA